jgi:aminopeptidase N
MYDEPQEGMVMSFNVPDNLIAVGNGRLIKTSKEKNKTITYAWEVKNPINNYGVNLNAGDYVHWEDTYDGEKGELDLSFWVLRDNLKTAKEHFSDAYKTLEALAYWFGSYPFYEESYKLVEVRYLGMEHQSSVTYGNRYTKGYLGRDLSGTGQGLTWDFIIIHESGHEWFANNITYRDIADMWIHEGFTSYSESLFIEYHYGKEAATEYTRGLRWNIENTAPVIGPYGVNKEGHSDMYYKGHNMLHMIRQVVDNDKKWRNVLRGLNQEFYHSTVSTKEIESYMSENLGIDLSKVFDQYLRNTEIPTLSYRITESGLLYKWINCVEGFDLPVKVYLDEEETLLMAQTGEKFLRKKGIWELKIHPDFYVSELNTMGE